MIPCTKWPLLLVLPLAGCAVVPGDTPAHGPLTPPFKAVIANEVLDVKPQGADAKDLAYPGTCPNGIEYIPVPPVPVSNYSVIKQEAGSGKWITEYKSWPYKNDKETDGYDPVRINALLTNISSNMASTQTSASGDFSLANASHAQRQYVFDFMKWRSEPIQILGSASSGGIGRVGAGLRVTVRISSNKAWAGGSLLSLAASLKADRLEGSVETELIGIDAADITMAFPFTTDLSEGNIQRIIESLGVLKAKFYDNKTSITPYHLARIACAQPPKSSKS